MLELRSLTRRFGAVPALDDVGFAVRPGVLTGFIGANGAGKTTTMRIVVGVLAADSGEVLWNGSPRRGRRAPPLRLHAGGARPLPEAGRPRPARVLRAAARVH